jgi:CheY-like chemotaxis protein
MSPHDLSLALFRPPIVLIVEDRPALRSATGRMVGALGYDVRSARTGIQALALVRSHPGLYDLVLADIHLADMDGGEFIERLRLSQRGIRLAWIAEYVPIGRAATLVARYPDVPLVKEPFGFRELRDVLTAVVGPPRAAMAVPGSLRSARRPVRGRVR